MITPGQCSIDGEVEVTNLHEVIDAIQSMDHDVCARLDTVTEQLTKQIDLLETLVHWLCVR